MTRYRMMLTPSSNFLTSSGKYGEYASKIRNRVPIPVASIPGPIPHINDIHNTTSNTGASMKLNAGYIGISNFMSNITDICNTIARTYPTNHVRTPSGNHGESYL